MPTYDYECSRCGHRFEAFHSISAEPLSACPKCPGKVTRMIGAGAGFLFKGSGFYETDYRSSDYKKAAAADSSRSAAPKKDKKTASKKASEKAK